MSAKQQTFKMVVPCPTYKDGFMHLDEFKGQKYETTPYYSTGT